jgi:hypothetical protein
MHVAPSCSIWPRTERRCPDGTARGFALHHNGLKKQSKKDELLALFPQALYPVSMPEKGLKTSKNGLASPFGKPDVSRKCSNLASIIV